MTFWEHFLRLLPKRPVPALAALYWHVTRRRVRALNRLRAASADLRFPYQVWVHSVERSAAAIVEAPAIIGQWSCLPKFQIFLYAENGHTAAQVAASVKSVEEQCYTIWSLQPNPSRSIAESMTASDADFVVPLRAGDVLSQVALFRFAEAIQRDRAATILFADEDTLDAEGHRHRPWFKPKWNEEMFLALDYVSGACAIRAEAAREAARTAGNIDELLLSVSSRAADAITRVPYVLCHRGDSPKDFSRRLAAVSRHSQAKGARCSPGPFGTIKVEWPLPDELPLVSIIVPTRDKLQFLDPCVRSLLDITEYPNFEILIADNGSIEADTKSYFRAIGQDPRVRISSFPGPFNYSAINNSAARLARGQYLCLLNNDTEVLDSAWLTEMVRYAIKPEIGAVGAKLLYKDRSIQHAGVVIGIGGAAGHAHRLLPSGQPGYFAQAHVSQFISAVTGACLLVSKDKFLTVGGLDGSTFAVTFNDVDFCLKLQAAGWRNLYVPHAVLLHHESKSRGSDMSRQNVGRFRREVSVLRQRWATDHYEDPSHHPSLDPAIETFMVRL